MPQLFGSWKSFLDAVIRVLNYVRICEEPGTRLCEQARFSHFHVISARIA